MRKPSFAVASLIDDLLRVPPEDPSELMRRLLPATPEASAREMIRRLREEPLDRPESFRLVLFLGLIGLGRQELRLIELLRDPGRPLERRAIAFVLLMQGEASELDRTMRSLGPKDPPRIVEAAAKWLEQFRDLDRAGGQPATRRARGRAGGRRSSRKRAIVRLKVTLRGIRPPIWRRIEVRDDVTFATLHQILQFAMGWTDTHLHRFEVEGETIAVPDPEWDEEIIDSKRIRLRDVIDRGVRRFLYEYDFGDDWRHDVAIEKIVDPDSRPPVARVVGGRRACPPEDCGGPYGYAAMIEALSDPAHEEHESWRGWGGIGGSPGTSRRRGRLRPPYPGPSRPGVGYRRRDAWDTAG